MNDVTKFIVVAEDEVFVRMAAVDVLIDAGFEVIEAEHAAAALAVMRVRADEIHILFTDINMPGTMNGLELAHHVRREWPHIGVLIASGLERPLLAALPIGSRFLAKPYEPDHLVTHIRSMIAAA